jgi:hypothetical protein
VAVVSPLRSTCEQELDTQRCIVLVLAPPHHRLGQWARIPDAPHLDTEMVGLEIDGDPVRLKHRIAGMHNLLPQSFLDRKTLGKQPHEAGELGNAEDGLMREIADVGMPEKGQGMVLAQREKCEPARLASTWPLRTRTS